ncbi:MAG: hypothetical protein IJ512_00650, partial [Ruminococcus sp.]|nr:hypothetical protein [Ruminococcus sp.]
MNLNQKIQSFLTKHKSKKQRLSATAILSVLIVLAVVSSLIMPAVSMAGQLICALEAHAHSEECVELICEEESHLHTGECYQFICGQTQHEHGMVCYTTLMHTDEEAAADENAVLVVGDEVVEDAEDTASSGVTMQDNWVNDVTAEILGDSMDENNQKEYTVRFTIDYFINAEDTQTYFKDTGNRVLTFSLADISNTEITVDPTFEHSGIVTGSTGSAIGTFTMDAETGLVAITFYDSFIEHADTGIDGFFYFQAQATGGGESDQTVVVAGKEVVIPISRRDKPAELYVSKKYNNDYDFSSGTASFDITINSNNGVDGGKITITDTLTGDLELNGIEVGSQVLLTGKVNSEENRGNDPNTTGTSNSVYATVTEIKEDGSVVLEFEDGALPYGFVYTWNCPVKIKDESADNTSISAQNAVNVTDGVKSAQANAYMSENLKPDISKGGNYDGSSGKDQINWVITVTNPQEIDLSTIGAMIDDMQLQNAIEGSIKLKDASGNETSVTLTDGAYVFPSGSVSGQYTLTYSTPAGSYYGQTVTNDASLITYIGEPSDEHSVDVPKQQSVDKDASFNGKEIEWKIIVNNPYGRDLADYVIEDLMLNGGNGAVSDVQLNGTAVTLTDGTFVFPSGSTASSYILTYKTAVSADKKGETFTNTASLKNNGV